MTNMTLALYMSAVRPSEPPSPKERPALRKGRDEMLISGGDADSGDGAERGNSRAFRAGRARARGQHPGRRRRRDYAVDRGGPDPARGVAVGGRVAQLGALTTATGLRARTARRCGYRRV